MLFYSVFILLTVFLSSSIGKVSKYCAISKNHSMCKYNGIGKACEKPGSGGVSKSEKELILDIHNFYRRKVATGGESRGIGGPQPKAANMMKLTWDDELQTIAQRWADQCTFQHDVRDVERWKVGQNLYWAMRYPVHEVNWTQAINSWYDEVENFDRNIVSRYSFNGGTGHYTQLVWHSTYKIGCGRRDYGFNKIYVCNYGPAGNWLGQPMYEEGEPCSRCPSGSTCEDSLCVEPTKRAALPDTNADTTPEKRQNEKVEKCCGKHKEMNIYLLVQYDGKIYLKPTSFLDTLLNLHQNSTNEIKDEDFDLGEKDKTTLQNLKNKLDQLDLHTKKD